MRTQFTTKGFDLVKPADRLYNNSHLDEAAPLGHRFREQHNNTVSAANEKFPRQLSMQPHIRRGFGLHNKTFGAKIVVGQPLETAMSGIGELYQDQEYLVSTEAGQSTSQRMFSHSPTNFRQTRDNLEFLKRTVVNPSEHSNLDW